MTTLRYVALRVAIYLSEAHRRWSATLIIMDVPEIDYRGELPPHRQIAAWIVARIETGELQPGQAVDSEKDLMDKFGVARTTARRAIGYLRESGVLRTVPGRGSYVAEKKN